MIENIKIGDTIIYVGSPNSNDPLLNRMFKVISVANRSIIGTLLNGEGLETMGYNVGYRITFSGNMTVILATKEAKIDWYNEQLKTFKDKIKELEAEIEFLEKYDSMEEYVADKLIAIMKTDDKDSLINMLKTLKQTNFL